VPVVGTAPFQPPEAVQALALVAVHCNVTEAPMATVPSLAFRLSNGGARTAGVAALALAVLLGGVLLVGPLLAEVVSAFELMPHAASEPSVSNANIEFNTNANRERWLRRIELIRVSQESLQQIFPRSSIPFIRNL
jgi:hypothetical protein